MEKGSKTRQEIAEMYKDHVAANIASRTDLTLYEVYKTLREADVEVRPRGRRPVLVSPGIEVLKAKLAEGRSVAGIARDLNVSKRTVQRWMGSTNSHPKKQSKK